MLLTKAFKKKFIIPNFQEFTQEINKLFDSAQRQEGGQVSNTHAQSVLADSLLSPHSFAFDIPLAFRR